MKEIKAYKVNNIIFENKKSAEKEDARIGLKKILDDIWYYSITSFEVADEMIERSEKIIALLKVFLKENKNGSTPS